MVRILVFLLSILATAAVAECRDTGHILNLGVGRQPRVAFSEDGAAYAVFGNDGVFWARSSDVGKSWSTPSRIPSLVGKMPLGMRRGPRICTAGDAIVITEVMSVKGGGADGDLVAVRSVDKGKTWSNPITISDTPRAAREGLDGLASDGHNRIAAVWLDLRDKGTTIMSSFSRDQGATWSRNVLVYRSPDGHVCECCHPSVVFDNKGTVHVMFRNWLGGNRDMYVASSSDFGATWGSAQKLGKGSWPLNACPMDGGEIGCLKQGTIAVWQRDGGIFTAMADGTSERRLDTGHQPTLATTAAGVWIAYLKGNDLWIVSERGESYMLAKDAADPVLASENNHVLCAWESDGHSFVTPLN